LPNGTWRGEMSSSSERSSELEHVRRTMAMCGTGWKCELNHVTVRGGTGSTGRNNELYHVRVSGGLSSTESCNQFEHVRLSEGVRSSGRNSDYVRVREGTSSSGRDKEFQHVRVEGRTRSSGMNTGMQLVAVSGGTSSPGRMRRLRQYQFRDSDHVHYTPGIRQSGAKLRMRHCLPSSLSWILVLGEWLAFKTLLLILRNITKTFHLEKFFSNKRKLSILQFR